MFVVVEMVDTVRIPPWQFQRQLNEAIAEELNKKLANKVVYNVGLCICLYDITKLEDSYIFPGDGASHTKECTSGMWCSILSWTRSWWGRLSTAARRGCTSVWDSSMTSSFRQSLCSSQPNSMRRNRCGFGSMRQTRGPTTSTWIRARRSASASWTKSFWTPPRLVLLSRQPTPQEQPWPRIVVRKRLRTR
ncbi:hypothetical protein ANANG_G00291650 [Anguilla anguilla]|uniref:DNA-directed RNA polymerase subunit n=1 Tax=Anguilla anguilla TaxID=7936 RepID=A0A9D3RJ88_ANGAN|nr:hypothetical protein ANANG_G00291650 [Anguilla anguilla]